MKRDKTSNKAINADLLQRCALPQAGYGSRSAAVLPERSEVMSWFSRLFGGGTKSKEFGGYSTKAEKDAWAQAMVGAEFISERNFSDALAIAEEALAKAPRCKEAWVVKGGAIALMNRPT